MLKKFSVFINYLFNHLLFNLQQKSLIIFLCLFRHFLVFFSQRTLTFFNVFFFFPLNVESMDTSASTGGFTPSEIKDRLSSSLRVMEPRVSKGLLSGIIFGLLLDRSLFGYNNQLRLALYRRGIIHGMTFITAVLCYCRPRGIFAHLSGIFLSLSVCKMVRDDKPRRRPDDRATHQARDPQDDRATHHARDPQDRRVPIGIFSRSGEGEYDWLSERFGDRFSVRPFFISNTNWREFTQRVSECGFAVLYHSKTRGRVNITDVTDSLYDQELEYMSTRLGKEKVIVVVDDLDDSGPDTKTSIVQNQPSIARLAKNVFLFSRADKANNAKLTEKVKEML
uniref:Uncharacterized protein n=1 Tax=Leptobrachium leishanense TaxID=445787 RepID=A0A8C5QI85_9ANUR